MMRPGQPHGCQGRHSRGFSSSRKPHHVPQVTTGSVHSNEGGTINVFLDALRSADKLKGKEIIENIQKGGGTSAGCQERDPGRSESCAQTRAKR